MRIGPRLLLAVLVMTSLVVAYSENNINPGTISASSEFPLEQSNSVSLSGADDWDSMEVSEQDSIGDVTWSADIAVTFMPSVGMSTSATVNELPAETPPSVVEVDFTITANVEDTASYVDDGPATTTFAATAKGKHRGRIQIQGDDMNPEVSWAWNQDDPPTKTEMITQLDNLYNGLTNAQKNKRKDAYKKAKKYIQGLPAAGADAVVMKTWQDTGTDTERIDLEIKTGKAGKN